MKNSVCIENATRGIKPANKFCTEIFTDRHCFVSQLSKYYHVKLIKMVQQTNNTQG